MSNHRSHTALRSTSGVARPAQRPGIHEVHQAAVHSPAARISAGEVVVVAMGTVVADVAVAEQYGPSISCKTAMSMSMGSSQWRERPRGYNQRAEEEAQATEVVGSKLVKKDGSPLLVIFFGR